MSHGPRILVFDSGVGGLTVVRALREQNRKAQISYCADTAGFPYGDWKEDALIERMIKVMAALIDEIDPDVVVIACNTASTIGLEAMRAKFDLPFVGTVPAIKPAANMTRSGFISVLATPGTVKREYTKALIDTYAFHCEVTLVGAERLAEMAEVKLAGGDVDLQALKKEIAPVFVEADGERTDVVVLACTHYPLLLDELKKEAPWSVEFINPAAAIARQTSKVVKATSFKKKPSIVVQAKAGSQRDVEKLSVKALNSSFRGNDEEEKIDWRAADCVFLTGEIEYPGVFEKHGFTKIVSLDVQR